MTLGYTKQTPAEPAHWFGDFGEEQKKFIRVAAGLAIPYLDRSQGAVIVLGELMRPSGPQDFTALAATVGYWPEIEMTLIQYRQDLKYGHIITEPRREIREQLWRIAGLSYGGSDIPLLTYEAPKYAVEETARQKIWSLIKEGRLHLELVESTLMLNDLQDPDVRALQSALIWMVERKPIYQAARPKRPPVSEIWGVEGL